MSTADRPHCGQRFVDVEPASSWPGMGTDTFVPWAMWKRGSDT